MSRTARQVTGDRAEAAARDYLQRQGMTLLQHNYRCRQGEIDLVMRHGDCTVFVEVRYRRSSRFASGAETVDRRKQLKLINAAAHFLQHEPRLAQQPARFDVISMSDEAGKARIEWIRDAFQTS